MISTDEFKNHLFEFVKFMDDPFDAKLIHKSCIQLIDIYRVYELQQLEDGGKIVSLPGGRYVTIKAAVRRWLKESLGIPDYLVRDIEWTMKLRSKRHDSLEAFILDALREHVAKVKEIYGDTGADGKQL